MALSCVYVGELVVMSNTVVLVEIDVSFSSHDNEGAIFGEKL